MDMDMYYDDADQDPQSGGKRSSGSSATSRKNKLQRCSVCGGLGHKSRTCDVAAMKMGAGVDALSSLLRADADPEVSRAVLAAHGLLTLAESPMPLQPVILNGADGGSWLQPGSPRILAA